MKDCNLVIVSGPTATGKTSTSIELAKSINTNSKYQSEIINFDSLLFYKELSIGTAKPTIEEMDGITHHLVGIASIKDELNASHFVKLAEEKINELMAKNIIPILVGGSAFYIRALIKGMYDSESTTEQTKQHVSEIYSNDGIEAVIKFLKINDPESLMALHENDHYRLTRAMEHFVQTGTKFSDQKKRMDANDPYDFSQHDHSNWNFHHIYLDVPKTEHWPIIQDRASRMLKEGLVNEVKNLLSNGYSGLEKPLNSIGYKETLAFLNDEFKNEAEYLERISISTRQLAKSQRTFFKKVSPKNSYHPILDKNVLLEQALERIHL